MGTYFHGNSEIQGDGLQTLILMNPGFSGYTDNQNQQQQPAPGNFVFLNSAAAGNSLNLQNFPHAPPGNQTQQFVGIPLQAPPNSHHAQHEISALHGFVPRPPYNIYGGGIDPTAVREVARAQQGLSLSLSSQQQQTGHGPAPQTISPRGDDLRVSGGSSSSASGISNGVNGGVQSVLLSSKYLKAAQELLDEVVNVGKGLTNGQTKAAGEQSAVVAGEAQSGSGDASGVKRSSDELSTAERQEIQMKKAKLINMLDEVEQRYRQYHHQMQIVISWFEQAAGIGSAKTYTALALQTISKQFRCLKDAITNQIKASTKSLGEEDFSGGGGGKSEGGGSRLKFVDHQLRQQRALQQLGMIQPNAWRPQRGLPERSVSVLRAWLFEHFLHPYPKDSDKHMLAKQTGLTRSQVSNWFINARVRLWKPMVEEMYMEEVKDQEQNGSEDNKPGRTESIEDSILAKSPATTDNQIGGFKSKLSSPTNQNGSAPVTPTMAAATTMRNQTGFSLIGSPEMETIGQGSPKKQRGSDILQYPDPVKLGEANNEQFLMKFGDDREARDGFSFMGGQNNFIGGFGSYSIGEIGRFNAEQFPGTYPGNGVSLTLGLPHCENLTMPGNHQSFLPNQMGRRLDSGEGNEFGSLTNTNPPSHSSAVYESINIQSPRRFAAQLLPDFVT